MELSLNRQELANLLKKRFKDLSLGNLRDASKLSGISASTLSRIVNCKVDPDAGTMAKLRSSPLEISIDSILQPSPQLTLNGYARRVQTPPDRKSLVVHFRGNKKKLEIHPNEVKEALVRIIRLAYEEFSAGQGIS